MFWLQTAKKKKTTTTNNNKKLASIEKESNITNDLSFSS